MHFNNLNQKMLHKFFVNKCEIFQLPEPTSTVKAKMSHMSVRHSIAFYSRISVNTYFTNIRSLKIDRYQHANGAKDVPLFKVL